MSSTYSDVDGSCDPGGAVRWQERIDSWPQIRAYKRRVVELLAGADPVLDLGCGPGADVVQVGVDRCVGLDRSFTMCVTASARGAAVGQADAQHLPIGSRRLGGVFADRVLQHVESPDQVLDELVRVLRPGGRLVVADPDQETLAIHLPGVRPDLADRVKARRRDVGYRNGRLVSSLPDRLAERGFTSLRIAGYPLILRDPHAAFGLPGWPRLWQSEGGFTEQEVQEWELAVDRSGAGFMLALTYFVVSASSP